MNEEYELAIAVIADSYVCLLKDIKRKKHGYKTFAKAYETYGTAEFDFLLGRTDTSKEWYKIINRRPMKCHQLITQVLKDLLELKEKQ